jgi:LmbE family N-acetylglucosaminyl deacetylase
MNWRLNPTYLLKRKILFGLLWAALYTHTGSAQDFSPKTSSEIALEIQKAANLTSVLYLAAHPDDENTRLISWLANEKHYRTGYLSLTRGDGGQNLTGSELREKLGIIRTQELLAARRIDGGEQFFTRANDFGYSKHPNETFSIWNRDSVLADVVYIIRSFKPDMLITRFPTTPGITHGHHTASAMLAEQAFKLAADPKAFPEQLSEVDVWQPKALYWNTSSWFFRGERASQYDTTNLVTLKVGGYNSLLGKSYPEIASLSRSQHRSQGFGTNISREQVTEYLEPIAVQPGYSSTSGLELSKSWGEVTGNKELDRLWDKVIQDYDFTNPAASVPTLLQVLTLLKTTEFPQKAYKLNQVKHLIANCLGLYVEATTDQPVLYAGQSVRVTVSAITRSENYTIKAGGVHFPELNAEKTLDQVLSPYTQFGQEFTLDIPLEFPLSHPYWLNGSASEAMFSLPKRSLLLEPDNPESLHAHIQLQINGTEVEYSVPVNHKRVERNLGEVIEPLYVVPAYTLQADQELLLAINQEAVTATVSITDEARLGEEGILQIELPKNWQADKTQVPVKFDNSPSVAYSFKIKAKNKKAASGNIKFSFITKDKTYSQQLVRLEAPHFPPQVYLPKAQAAIRNISVETNGGKVAYISGAGDEIPQALQILGYSVEVFGSSEIGSQDLSSYKALVFGIRALNIHPELDRFTAELDSYVRDGGVVLFQYNTSRAKLPIGSDTLSISRDRVTDEAAAVTILAPKAKVLNYPNQITDKDWNDWVQERGLYFPTAWSENWQPVIGISDVGEDRLDGSLLVRNLGRGTYIYTGLSLFREIPAGVPGAYRLLANFIESGQN